MQPTYQKQLSEARYRKNIREVRLGTKRKVYVYLAWAESRQSFGDYCNLWGLLSVSFAGSKFALRNGKGTMP